MKRFSISLPNDLLSSLDKKLDGSNYPSRSEFIRDLLRKNLVENEWEQGDVELMGIFSIMYSHHEFEFIKKLTSLEHKSKVKIICTTHIHLDNHNCLESIILKGKSGLIKEFCDEIASMKGVKFSSLAKTGLIDL